MAYNRPKTSTINSNVDGKDPKLNVDVSAANAGFGVIQENGYFEVLDALPLKVASVQNSTDYTAADDLNPAGDSEIHTITFTGTPEDSTAYTVTIADVASSFTTDASATLAEFAAAVDTNIGTLSGATLSHTTGDDFVTITYTSGVVITDETTVVFSGTGTGVDATIAITSQGNPAVPNAKYIDSVE